MSKGTRKWWLLGKEESVYGCSPQEATHALAGGPIPMHTLALLSELIGILKSAHKVGRGKWTLGIRMKVEFLKNSTCEIFNKKSIIRWACSTYLKILVLRW